MKTNIPTHKFGLRGSALAILFVLVISSLTYSQITYNSSNEQREAGMGVERVARFFTPVYASKPAQTDDEMTEYSGEEKEYHGRFALEYGPVLMEYVNMKGEKEYPHLQTNTEKFIKSLKPISEKPLHYIIDGSSDYEYMPYFEVQYESFTCFH